MESRCLSGVQLSDGQRLILRTCVRGFNCLEVFFQRVLLLDPYALVENLCAYMPSLIEMVAAYNNARNHSNNTRFVLYFISIILLMHDFLLKLLPCNQNQFSLNKECSRYNLHGFGNMTRRD